MKPLSDDAVARLRASPAEIVIADRFEVLEEAGAGGMGTVYRARDRRSGGLVALKVLLGKRHGELARFEREARLLASITHPAIVGYVAHGATEEGEPWLAMEWLEGTSLARRLESGRLGWREAVLLARRVADALSAAHAVGIVHRDLKPTNLFLPRGDVLDVKVLDFGIARHEGGESEVTRTGEVVGTPGYMAPEQARSSRDVDARADLFSLGCVVYRCIAGEPAFEGDDVLEVLAKLVLHEPPSLVTRLPDLPPALGALVTRLMRKEPSGRPQHAADVVRELDRILADPTAPSLEELDTLAAPGAGTPLTTARPPPLVAPRPVDRRVWIGAALAGAAGLALWAWMPLDAPSTSPSVVATVAPTTPTPTPALQTCRTWATALTRAQRDDGSFGLERHRIGVGWTTGQAVFALAQAHARCGDEAVDRAALTRGIAALDAFRRETGWIGGPDVGAIETPATAWALLAHGALASTDLDPAAREAVIAARAMLAASEAADGGFCPRPGCPGEVAHGYTTTLALWALVETEPLDPSPQAIALRARATAWLRAALTSSTSAVRTVAGLTEQATYVLARADALAGGDRDASLFETLAAQLVQRCRLEGGRCDRALDEDGELSVDEEGAPNFVTLWLPWASLASHARIAPSHRAALEAVASWSEDALSARESEIAGAPSYKLAEHLLAVSALVP